MAPCTGKLSVQTTSTVQLHFNAINLLSAMLCLIGRMGENYEAKAKVIQGGLNKGRNIFNIYN